MASPYRINLPAYEGPLDLLLDLIRKQEMDIHNIPIAKITEQYLDYLHQLEKFDIDVSADFIYMAATLIHIKSKMDITTFLQVPLHAHFSQLVKLPLLQLPPRAEWTVLTHADASAGWRGCDATAASSIP